MKKSYFIEKIFLSSIGFYPRNVDCQYVFLGAKDQVVFVTFEYFDVEGRGQ